MSGGVWYSSWGLEKPLKVFMHNTIKFGFRSVLCGEIIYKVVIVSHKRMMA